MKLTHFCLVILIFSFSATSYAQSSIERRLSRSTDASAEHLFLNNPAAFQPVGLKLGGFFLRESSDHTLRQERTGNLSEIKSSGKEDLIGVAALSDFGAGLSLGISHMRSFDDVATSDLNATEPRNEFFKKQYTIGKAVIELSESLTVGVSVRHLAMETSVRGAMFVDEDDQTNYQGTLYGIGGGFMFHLNQIKFGMAYHPPLKGKSEIYGEEIIVTDPGMGEANATYSSGKIVFGFSFIRNLYKEDDRFEGTTINDDNQTQISLFGLSPEKNNLFFLEEKQVGLDYMLVNKGLVKLGVAVARSEFNFAPSQDIPGDNGDLETYKYYRFSASYVLTNPQFKLEIGGNYSLKNHSYESNNSTQIDFSGYNRDIYINIIR
jgi:hypothetical protein